MDNDNIDFKNLWKQQIVSKPSLEEFMVQLNKFKKAGLKTYWITNAVLALTSVEPLITLDTVRFETPASLATSLIVGFFSLIIIP